MLLRRHGDRSLEHGLDHELFVVVPPHEVGPVKVPLDWFAGLAVDAFRSRGRAVPGLHQHWGQVRRIDVQEWS